MGKSLELPDDVYEIVEREAAARRVAPSQFICDMLRQARHVPLSERLLAAGLVMNQSHGGAGERKPPPEPLQTLDGSLVSDVIIRERR
jgi:hypothetical protein